MNFQEVGAEHKDVILRLHGEFSISRADQYAVAIRQIIFPYPFPLPRSVRGMSPTSPSFREYTMAYS